MSAWALLRLDENAVLSCEGGALRLRPYLALGASAAHASPHCFASGSLDKCIRKSPKGKKESENLERPGRNERECGSRSSCLWFRVSASFLHQEGHHPI
jgi:hypothetical protein